MFDVDNIIMNNQKERQMKI